MPGQAGAPPARGALRPTLVLRPDADAATAAGRVPRADGWRHVLLADRRQAIEHRPIPGGPPARLPQLPVRDPQRSGDRGAHRAHTVIAARSAHLVGEL